MSDNSAAQMTMADSLLYADTMKTPYVIAFPFKCLYFVADMTNLFIINVGFWQVFFSEFNSFLSCHLPYFLE